MGRLVEEIEYRDRLRTAAETLGRRLDPLERSLESLVASADASARDRRQQQSALASILTVSNLQLARLAEISTALANISTTLDSMLDVMRHPRRTEGMELRDLGMKALERGKLRLARENLEESLQLYRHDPLTHFWLATTLLRLDEPQLALAEFENAIEHSIDDHLEPLIAGAAVRASSIAKNAGDRRRARRILEGAIEQIQPRRCPHLSLALSTVTQRPTDLAAALLDDPLLLLDAEVAGLSCTEEAAKSACTKWTALRTSRARDIQEETERIRRQLGISVPHLGVAAPPDEPRRQLLDDVEVLGNLNAHLDAVARTPADVPPTVTVPNGRPASGWWGCLVFPVALVAFSIAVPALVALFGGELGGKGQNNGWAVAVIFLAALVSIGAVGALRARQNGKKERAQMLANQRSRFVGDVADARRTIASLRVTIRSDELVVPW